MSFCGSGGNSITKKSGHRLDFFVREANKAKKIPGRHYAVRDLHCIHNSLVYFLAT